MTNITKGLILIISGLAFLAFVYLNEKDLKNAEQKGSSDDLWSTNKKIGWRGRKFRAYIVAIMAIAIGVLILFQTS